MSEVREYVRIRYRLRKPRVFHNLYDLNKARVRFMHMSKLPEFQLSLRMGGHTVLSISRLTKEEYHEQKREMIAHRVKRKQKELQEV